MAPHKKRAPGFSLVEVLVALSLIGLASSTLLLATASSMQSGNDALAQTVARGIAEQLLDEVLGQLYCEPGGSPTSWPLGPDTGEISNPPKTVLFDDTDDYHNYSATPLRDGWGIPLGHGDENGGLRGQDFRLRDDYFKGWTVRITLTYADENNPTRDLASPNTSVIRAVRIRITRTWSGGVQQLVNVRRVFAYVPAVRT